MREEMVEAVKSQEIEIQHFYDALPEHIKRHSEAVANLTVNLLTKAEREGLCDEDPLPLPVSQIGRAVLYHDVGVALIPERLFNKKEELTSAERRVVERHARYGAKLLDKYRKGCKYPPEEEPLWRLAAEVAVTHHERWDGRGYPFGMVATAIPIVSRAVALADSYNAIVNSSPFRMALPHEYAILEIVDNAGTQFDPELVELFNKYESEICMKK